MNVNPSSASQLGQLADAVFSYYGDAMAQATFPAALNPSTRQARKTSDSSAIARDLAKNYSDYVEHQRAQRLPTVDKLTHYRQFQAPLWSEYLKISYDHYVAGAQGKGMKYMTYPDYVNHIEEKYSARAQLKAIKKSQSTKKATKKVKKAKR